MLKVEKNGCVFDIPSNRIVSVQEAYDGIIITLNEGTEIRFTVPLSPNLRSLLPIVQNSSINSNVVFSIDNAMRGDYGNTVKIS